MANHHPSYPATFRKTYISYLRSVTIAAVLAVAVTVVRAQYVLWMDF